MPAACFSTSRKICFIGALDVSREFKLDELRQFVLSMDYFQKREMDISCIRIREKMNNMYFGKIYRDRLKKATLKGLGIKKKGQIVN